jgi:hypothetical protein
MKGKNMLLPPHSIGVTTLINDLPAGLRYLTIKAIKHALSPVFLSAPSMNALNSIPLLITQHHGLIQPSPPVWCLPLLALFIGLAKILPSLGINIFISE